MKRSWIIAINVGGLFLMTSAAVWLGATRISCKMESNVRFANVLKQQAVLKMGRKLIKAGDFEGALEKFNEALDSKYVKSDFDKTQVVSSKADLYILWGKYTDALKEYDWIFERTPGHQYSVAKHEEILALVDWEKTRDNQIIYDYIVWLKNHFREQIPPVGYKGYITSVISTILRLYDTIGDYSAGISYIDEILSFLKERHRGEKEYAVFDRIKTVDQAVQCMEVGPAENSDWHECKFLKEYLLVREAFEKEKAEGTKGYATKALIESNYFPW